MEGIKPGTMVSHTIDFLRLLNILETFLWWEFGLNPTLPDPAQMFVCFQNKRYLDFQ